MRASVCISYRPNSAEKPAVTEEDDQERNREMEDEHVDDKRRVVVFRLWGVVIYSTRTLHPFWNVPV